jgi:hypothetical protein
LITRLREIRPGPGDAASFQELVGDIFTLLFKDQLFCLGPEYKIEGGHQRIDILFYNRAVHGFFADLQSRDRIPCTYIPVECKNYSVDPENPENSQLLNRFGDQLGKFGFLVCNQIRDRGAVVARCAPSAKAGRGSIIALDGNDLRELLFRNMLPTPDEPDTVWCFLRERVNELIL